MPNFNKKIFGSNIDARVKNRLMARQALSENANPNDSIQFTDVNGKTMDLDEAVGTHNFKKDGLYLADLSSRTPWARAWVAVELYYHKPAEFGRATQKFVPAEYGTRTITRGNTLGTETYIKKKEHYITEKGIIKKEKNYSFEKKVYVLGDNNYDLFSGQHNLHDPIMGKDKFKDHKDKGSVNLNKQFPNEMQNNPLMRPASGITSIESKTDGFAGAIRRTTVNFIVHNFDDFQNIYGRYFLKPGATVVVDFGWDVSAVYKPESIIEDIRGGIYGTGKILDKAAGDLEVIVGKVSDFTSTVDENGSFICSMTIISDNASVIDYEISNANNLKSKMVDDLPVTLINKVAGMLGKDFLKKDWSSDPGDKQESEWYANSWANNLFSSGKNNSIIPEFASKVGLYWQSLGTEQIDIKKSLINDTEANIAVTDDNNIFISWAFFEEEVLNKNLGFDGDDASFFGGHFDSIDSFITYEPNLLQRQLVGSTYSRKKTGFKFLYPQSWDETYDTINHKRKTDLRERPEKSKDINDITQGILNDDVDILGLTKAVEGKSVTDLDVATRRIPLRELFINLSIIKDAFSNNDNVSEAILEILDVLNGDSQNVFNLKLVSSTRDNSTITIIDIHYYNSTNDEFVGDKFENMFKFKPYSKGSIVKEMSLAYQTPNNSLQTMIAIQNRSTNIPLFPSTEIQDENQAMRIIYGVIEGKYGVRYLPQPDVTGKNNEEQESSDSGGENAENLLDSDTPADSIIGDYRGILKKSEEYQGGEGKDLYLGTKDNYYIGDPKPSETSDVGSDTPADNVYPDALYAKDLEEYFEYRCRTNFVHKNISPLIPIELSLTTYGMSGITPGNIFNVDYLPVQYKDRTYFQVMNVEHSVDSSGWKTTFQTQMRVRQEQIKVEYFKTPDIYVSTESSLLASKLHKDVKKYFVDFLLDERTRDGVLVFRVYGRLAKGQYRAVKTMNDGDRYVAWLEVKYPTSTNKPPKDVPISLDREYTLLVGNGGAIAIDLQDNYHGQIENLIKNFKEFVDDPLRFGSDEHGGATQFY